MTTAAEVKDAIQGRRLWMVEQYLREYAEILKLVEGQQGTPLTDATIVEGNKKSTLLANYNHMVNHARNLERLCEAIAQMQQERDATILDDLSDAAIQEESRLRYYDKPLEAQQQVVLTNAHRYGRDAIRAKIPLTAKEVSHE